jgi:phospholipid/cholesterol/gamma-HCH transport system substrate-binding protein
MENKAHALAAGAFVILVGALLTIFALWLTREVGVQRVYEMSTREAVSGLRPQAVVRYRGIDVGKVEAIGFDPAKTGNVLIRIAVDDRAPITQSTYASLGYLGVTGLAFVQLDDEGASTVPLAGDAAHPPHIPMRPGLFSRITSRGDILVDEAEKTMVSAQETMARIAALLTPQNQEALLATIGTVGTAANGVDRAAGSVHEVAVELRGTLHTLETVSSEISKTAAQTTETAAELSRSARQISGRLSETADALISAAATLNATTLPRVHRVSDDTSATMTRAARMFDAVSDNPQSLIYGDGTVPPGPGEDGFVAPGSAR